MKVIKFGATWCSGCLVMKPRWQEIEQDNPWLETEFYDFDESPDEVRQYAIDDNLPVAVFVDKDGHELQRFNGEVEKELLLDAIEAHKSK